MANIAEKAEADFDDCDLSNVVPPISIQCCVQKCISFLLGGLHRNFNILDRLSSTGVMGFIDK